MGTANPVSSQPNLKISFDNPVTAPFNNMQNLKFNSPPMVAFFLAVNQGSGSL